MKATESRQEKDLLNAVRDYIEATLDETMTACAWNGATRLPLFLVDRYAFYRSMIMGKPCLLVLQRGGETETPATLRKHLSVLVDEFDGDAAYVAREMTAYNRKRLIEHRVPFVVPRRQLYLPGFGIDLREQFARTKQPKHQRLGAVSQLLVLREIYHGDTADRPLGEWAEYLGYSAMTISRAIDELIAMELAARRREGRARYIGFLAHGKELWELARNTLQTPVRKTIWVEDRALRYQVPLAGESALAKYTLLSPPPVDTVAVFDRDSQVCGQLVALPEDQVAEAGLQVQRWRYDPRLVKEGPLVDELSLWLSLQGHVDERVQAAADELLEQVPW